MYMASNDAGVASVANAMEEIPQGLSSADDRPSTAGSTTRTKEENKPASSSPRRNGIPPKRPLHNASRATGPTHGSATKSTIIPSASGRIAPSSGLGKPPTRPMATSSARRPTNVAPGRAQTSSHASRPSMSSVEEGTKAGAGSDEENRKPTISGVAKGASISGTPARPSSRFGEARPTNSSTHRRTPGGSQSDASAMSRRPTTSRTETTSPTKTRSTTSSARPAATPSTARGSRSSMGLPKTTSTLGGSNLSRKRLSTIPASPATGQTDNKSTSGSQSPTKSKRPTLGARKSTLSVTIEQRLREMEVVNEMLTAAMADEGEEAEELKEQYGKKADETLATLREKLEEARRAEGKAVTPPIQVENKTEDSTVPPATSTGDSDDESRRREDVDDLRAALNGSQDMISILQSEVKDLRTKISDSSIPWKDSDTIERATQNAQQEHNSALERLRSQHEQELGDIRKALADSEASHQIYVEESVRSLEDAKHAALSQESEKTVRLLEEQHNAHDQELRSMQDGMVSSKKDVEEQKNIYDDRLRVLEADMELSRRTASDAASNVRTLESERNDLSKQLEQEREKSKTEFDSAQRRFGDLLLEKDEALAVKDKDFSSLQREFEELQFTQSRELEEVEAKASNERDDLKAELVTLKDEIRESQQSQLDTSQLHEDTIAAKDRELDTIGEVVSGLQDEIHSLLESKEREVDATKVELIEEHERILSKLHAEHQLELQKAHDQTQANLAGSQTDLSREIQRLNDEYSLTKQQLEGTIAEVLESKLDLESTVESLNKDHSAASTEQQDLLKTAFEEAESLKKSLDIVESTSREMAERHAQEIAKLKTETAESAKALLEKGESASALQESRITELQNDNDDYQSQISGLVAEHDSLQEKYRQLENQHVSVQDALKAKHATRIEDLGAKHTKSLAEAHDSHKQAIEDFKSQLELDYDQGKRDYRAESAENLAKAEEQHKNIIDELRKHHENSYNAMRDEIELVTRNEIQAVQTQHGSELTELRAQVIQHREAASAAEGELQAYREAQVATHRDPTLEQQVEDLSVRLEAAEAQSKDLEETKNQLGRQTGIVESLKKQLSEQTKDMEETRAKDSEIMARLTASAHEASRANESDNSEAEQLKQKIVELAEKHTVELTRLQETMSIENEKREKERKSGAEVRDSLARQLQDAEEARKMVPGLKNTVQQHRRAAEVASADAQNAQNQLKNITSTMKVRETEIKQTLSQLNSLQAEFAAYKETSDTKGGKSSNASTSDVSNEEFSLSSNQELEALQSIADNERERSDKLVRELKDAKAVAEKHATRVREMEAALKVTSAELTEMKTCRVGESASSLGSSARIGKDTLKNSRRTDESLQDGSMDGGVEVEDKEGGQETRSVEERRVGDLGAHIEGAMAGIQEQIRQLEDVNEGFMQDEKRLVNMLSNATAEAPRNQSKSSGSSNGNARRHRHSHGHGHRPRHGHESSGRSSLGAPVGMRSG